MGKYEHRKSEKGKKKKIHTHHLGTTLRWLCTAAGCWLEEEGQSGLLDISTSTDFRGEKKKEKSMAKKKDICAVVPVQMYANLNGQTCAYTQGKVDNEGQLNQRRLPLQYSLGRFEANVHCVACAILVVCYRHFRFMGVLGWVAT